MAEPVLFLIHVGGKKDGQTIRVDQPNAVVGRDPKCEVALDFYGSAEISSRHATLTRQGASYVIADSSLNGTYINGRRIPGPTELQHCDLIQLGTAGPELRVGINHPPPGTRSPSQAGLAQFGLAGGAAPAAPAPTAPPQGTQASRPAVRQPTVSGAPVAAPAPAAAAPLPTANALSVGGPPSFEVPPESGATVAMQSPLDPAMIERAMANWSALDAAKAQAPAAAPPKAAPAQAKATASRPTGAQPVPARAVEQPAPAATMFMDSSQMPQQGATVAAPGGAGSGARPRLQVDRLDGVPFSRVIDMAVVRFGLDPRAEISFAQDTQAQSFVEEHHAKVMWSNGEYVLVDSDSEKRTFHNGKPLHRLPLRGGEVIELGQGGPKLRFSLLAPAPVVAAPSASSGGELSDVQVGGGRTYAMAGAAAIVAQQLAARRNQARLLKEVPLRSKPMEIGRLGNMDLTLDSIQVSKRHARLEMRQVAGQPDPVPFIVDLGGANGTYVKGERVTGEVQIKPGDDIYIGQFMLQVEGKSLKIFDFRQASISCQGLTRQDPKTKRVFLDQVSIVIKPSEFVVFLGPSGSGKSTLLKTLTGADRPQGGKVLINDVDFFANYERLKQSVGYVPQEDIVHAELSVRRTLEYAAELRLPKELDQAGRQKRIEEVLSILELTTHQHKPVFKLSGGQKKRVSIGVELLTEPSMLYLDEPTSGLDANLEGKMMLLFRELSLRGNTVVCVTHHLDNVHLADKVGIMFDGKLAFYGAPNEALEHFKCKRMAEIFERLGETQDAEVLKNDYLGSEYYASHLAGELFALEIRDKETAPKKGEEKKHTPVGAGALAQFSILSRRYIEILTRDLRNTIILLLQAPIVAGVICIAIPTNFLVRSPTSTLLLVLCLSALWFGCSNAAREITKESSIFKRERMVSLQVLPYVFSKFFVLQLFSLIQCLLMQLIVFRFADTPAIRFIGTDGSSWLLSLANLYLLSLSGIGLGLLISAFSGNSDKAMSLVPIVLIPQILLSGGFGLFRQGSAVRPVAYLTSLNWALDGHKRIATCPLGEKAQCFACLTPTDPDIEEADPEVLPKHLRAIKDELPTRCIADGQRTKSETTEIVMTGLYGAYTIAPEGAPRTKVKPKNGFIVLGGMSILFFIGVSVALRVKDQ